MLFRLLCPFSVELPMGIMPAADTSVSELRGTVSQYVPEMARESTQNNPGSDLIVNDPVNLEPDEILNPDVLSALSNPSDPSDSTSGASDKIWRNAINIGAAVWALGVLVILGHTAYTYLSLSRKVRFAVKADGCKNVFESDGIPAPFVLGLLRARIYIPFGLVGDERDYVLNHERTHIRRGDHIIKLLAFFALALHWFNPLAWVFCRLMTKDMEMSCDEAVLRNKSRELKKSYCTSMLSLSRRQSGIMSPIGFGEGNTKERIKHVLKMKKHSITAIILATVISAVILTGCGVNGVVKDKVDEIVSEAVVSDAVPEEPHDPTKDPIIPENYKGHFSDYIDLDDFIVIQNEYIKIFIPKEWYYSPDIEETMMQAINWVEDFTEMNTLTRKIDKVGYIDNKQNLEWNQDLELRDPDERCALLFYELASLDNKFVIFPVSYPCAIPAADGDFVQLTEECYKIDSYDSDEFGTLLHEFTHSAQIRYAENVDACYPMQEGLAVWVTRKIAKEQDLDKLYNYNNRNYKTGSLPADLEAYFAGDWFKDIGLYDNEIRNNNPYDYGYVFYLYLEETCGNDIFYKIFKEGKKNKYRYDRYGTIAIESARLYVEAIKKVTSEDVFKDCQVWFNKNKNKIYK